MFISFRNFILFSIFILAVENAKIARKFEMKITMSPNEISVLNFVSRLHNK